MRWAWFAILGCFSLSMSTYLSFKKLSTSIDTLQFSISDNFKKTNDLTQLMIRRIYIQEEKNKQLVSNLNKRIEKLEYYSHTNVGRRDYEESIMKLNNEVAKTRAVVAELLLDKKEAIKKEAKKELKKVKK